MHKVIVSMHEEREGEREQDQVVSIHQNKVVIYVRI